MIDIGDVKVGDRVRLTRANGDDTTFLVVRKAPLGILWSETNPYDVDDWDTIEILPKPLPSEPGFYVDQIGDLWVIFEGTDTLVFICPDCSSRGEVHTATDPNRWAPFTRLVPEGSAS